MDRLAVYLGPFADYPAINGILPLSTDDCTEDEREHIAPMAKLYKTVMKKLIGNVEYIDPMAKLYENIGLPIPYTGTIEIGKDYQYNGDVTMGPFECNYRTKLLLTFENGVLKSHQDISSQRGEKIIARTFPSAEYFMKLRPNQTIPDDIPQKDIYIIKGKQYSFLSCLGFAYQKLSPHLDFHMNIHVPVTIHKSVGNIFYPIYQYEWDKNGTPYLRKLWFPLRNHDSIDKVEVFQQKPDEIIGENPRFAVFSFSSHPITPYPSRNPDVSTGFLLLGTDGEGEFPWNYRKVIIARLDEGRLWDTQDVSDELAAIRQWTKEKPMANDAAPPRDRCAEYEPFIKAFPELYKKRPWWFIEPYEKERQIDYTAPSIIGDDEFAKRVLAKAKEYDAERKKLEKRSAILSWFLKWIERLLSFNSKN